MAPLASSAESILAAVTTGSARTSGGWSHSAERPTRRSAQPMAATISVALGSSEQTRRRSA
jgi:hypothetical protein